jgi:hypothetical protein
MPGLPKKYAKLGFKKGWAMFRRMKGGMGIAGGRMPGTKRKKHSRRSYSFGSEMNVPALISRPVKSLSSITPQKIVAPLIDLGLLVLGMSLGASIKKMVPIKNPHLMNGTHAVVGIGGSLMTKNRFVKMPLLGVALQGTIAEAKLLMPKLPLAGDDEVMYLPVGEDEGEPGQLEYVGEEGDRIGEVIGEDAEFETVAGDDDRLAEVIGNDEYEIQGEVSYEGASDY